MHAIANDFFKIVGPEGIALDELFAKLHIKEGEISRLYVNYLISLQLLSLRDGKVFLTPTTSELMDHNYEGVKSWVIEMLPYYDCLGNLDEVLKTGDFKKSKFNGVWNYITEDDVENISPNNTENYSTQMDGSMDVLGDKFIVNLPFEETKKAEVLEFGGGYGGLAKKICGKFSKILYHIVDLPSVLNKTEEEIEKQGLSHRIKLHRRDFFKEDIPVSEVDYVVFCRIINDWDDHRSLRLLENAKRALMDGGEVIILETMNDDHYDEFADPGALFSAFCLALLGGKRRSYEDFRKLLRRAGFGNIKFQKIGYSNYNVCYAMK